MQHMGQEMHTQQTGQGNRDKQPPQASLPAALAEVALIDAKTCAATGGMSVSQWHNLVREGSAPKPLIRNPRYTRWGLADVRQYFLNLTTQGTIDGENAVIARAKKASNAAKAKRQQKALNTTVAA